MLPLCMAVLVTAPGCGGGGGASEGKASIKRLGRIPGFTREHASDTSATGEIVVGTGLKDGAERAVIWNGLAGSEIPITDATLRSTAASAISAGASRIVGNAIKGSPSGLKNILLVGSPSSLSPVEMPKGFSVNQIYPFDISDDGSCYGYLEYDLGPGESKPSYFLRTADGVWSLKDDLSQLAKTATPLPSTATVKTVATLSENRTSAVGWAILSDFPDKAVTTVWRNDDVSYAPGLLKIQGSSFLPLNPCVSDDGNWVITRLTVPGSDEPQTALFNMAQNSYVTIGTLLAEAGSPLKANETPYMRIDSTGSHITGLVADDVGKFYNIIIRINN